MEGVPWLATGNAKQEAFLLWWHMTISLVFFSGLKSAMCTLGTNKHANCTAPLRLSSELRVIARMVLLVLKTNRGKNANQMTHVV